MGRAVGVIRCSGIFGGNIGAEVPAMTSHTDQAKEPTTEGVKVAALLFWHLIEQ